mmetsp:Transcript_74476/g.213477  ORF Transcript_74476/g.213477 Transcript_74476/m.213477 type:complete len:213 (-) Transcript_74476:961-1599(-)
MRATARRVWPCQGRRGLALPLPRRRHRLAATTCLLPSCARPSGRLHHPMRPRAQATHVSAAGSFGRCDERHVASGGHHLGAESLRQDRFGRLCSNRRPGSWQAKWAHHAVVSRHDTPCVRARPSLHACTSRQLACMGTPVGTHVALRTMVYGALERAVGVAHTCSSRTDPSSSGGLALVWGHLACTARMGLRGRRVRNHVLLELRHPGRRRA